MAFFYYDISFLVIFCLIVGIFLYRNRKKLQVESKVFILYRTKIGLRIIEKLSRVIPSEFLSTVIIASGYLMMASALYLLYISIKAFSGMIVVPNVPPLMPLIPYVTTIFKTPFLPPLYFTYWIITICIIAVVHEFAHGIFARFYGIKLKATGFGFLGPLLAAFVELDEKQMAKKKIKAQLAVLSAGSFANLVFAVIFFLLMQLFFAATFISAGVIMPDLNVAGVTIPSYSLAEINASSIPDFNLTKASEMMKEDNLTEIEIVSEGKSYFLTPDLALIQKSIQEKNKQELDAIIAYEDTPAYNAKIKGVIQEINGIKITDYAYFDKIMSTLNPNETIKFKTSEGNYTIKLAEYPGNSSRGYLGIGFPADKKESAVSGILKTLTGRKDSYTYFTSSSIAVFIYNLLLWITLINFSVMIMNMLPFSIFDGGRFFYLTALALTKSKKKAFTAFKVASMIVLLMLLGTMVVWLFKI